jgi:uncharacterized membrane protein YkvA (DUF1232 family)
MAIQPLNQSVNPAHVHSVKKDFWAKVKETASKVPFIPDAIAMYFCAIDPATPLHAKGIAFGALAYFILPLDVIPDMLAVAGYTDDAAILAAAARALAKHVTEGHRQKAADWLASRPVQIGVN